MPKLTIVDRTADVCLPAAARDPDVYIWKDLAGRPCAYGHTVDGRHWMHWPSLASYSFDDDGGEILAYRSPAAAPDAVADTFHRMVLPLALQRRGLEALHASATTIDGRVVAFCAVSGTGKSTLAYALHQAGHHQWSDDVVVFDVGAAAITAVPLPFDVRLLPEAAAQFSGERARRVAVRSSAAPGRAAVGAICILARRGAREFGPEVGVRPLASAQALAAVLEHAHCFNLTDAQRKKAMLQHYLDLVERVPVLEVRFRPGLHRLPAVVDALVPALGL